jgi:cell division protein FtsN
MRILFHFLYKYWHIMASKDYVKRPQAKKQSKKRTTPNPKSNGAAKVSKVSWSKVAIALLVVLLFIFGLYRLQTLDLDRNNDNSEMSGDITPAELVIVESETALEAAKLPPLPVLGEEEWEYIDSLPDYSVEVDATGPLESSKEYIMQCGSFRTIDRAEELRAKIAFQGLESRILTSDGKNGLWYRVVLGPYERKREAERHRHQLRSGNVNGCKIW